MQPIPNSKSVCDRPELVAALQLIALGERDRMQGKGISAAEARAQLLAARQNRK